jgi:HSP20 family molecular chaperone IbpA
MSRVTIQRLSDFGSSSPLIEEWNHLMDEIREKAFLLFERRGGGFGRELDDWLAAEREILWPAPAELVETDNDYQLRVAVPGFDAGEIQVTAMPNAIVVEAESKPTQQQGSVHLAEFGGKKLYRRLEFASVIDPDKITAKVGKGVLELVAAKAAEPKAQKTHVASGAA